MDQTGVTLEELSTRSGVEQRTLRSWIAEGLLAPPLRSGRGATYPAANIDRALAIRALKDIHGLTLAKIGRMFLTASDRQIRSWAEEAGGLLPPPGSARDYLRALREKDARGPAEPDAPVGIRAARFERRFSIFHKPSLLSPSPEGDVSPADRGRLEKLIVMLQTLLAEPAQRRSRGTVWTRIEITPDLELAVRGELDPAERQLFLQLADQIRALLTERTMP